MSVCYNGAQIHGVFTEANTIMMPCCKSLSLIALSVLALTSLAPGAAQAQQSAPATTAPKLEPIDDVNDTPITVTSKPAQRNEVQEHRQQGQVTEVKVTSGPSTYYLKPNPNPQGGDIPGRNLSGPQWRVMEFGGKKKSTHEDDGPDVAPVPAPPAVQQQPEQ